MIFLTKWLESKPTMEDEGPNSTSATTSPTKGKDEMFVLIIYNSHSITIIPYNS